jgi:hypothetical protein
MSDKGLPQKMRMDDLKAGDKFIIPNIGGMNTFIKQSDHHGFTEYHYSNSQNVKTTSVSNCTVYKIPLTPN